MHMDRQPRGSYILYPLLSLEVASPEHVSMVSILSPVYKKVRARYQNLTHK